MTARERFAAARVARLATVAPDGRPHLVPVCFAVRDDTVYSAVDAKPKATTDLKRLRNAVAHPQVALLADHYDEDWTELWWVRADGTARVLDPGDPESSAARALLTLRYPPYVERPPEGPVLAVDVSRWSAWEAAARGRDPR